MPVRFVCPECRRVLSVTRRKIGFEVTCPKCLALVTVPDGGQAPAKAAEGEPSAEEEGELPIASGLAFFDNLPDLAVSRRPILAGPPTTGLVSPGVATANHVLVTRTAVYLQAVLLLVVAATAFGLGYWLGGIDARPEDSKPPAASNASDGDAGRTS